MNSKILPAALTAVVGFALGWAVKPSGTSAAGSAALTDPTAQTKPSGPQDRPDRPPLILPKRASERNETTAEGTIVRADPARAMRDVVSNAERSRLLRLSEALGLDPEQEQQLAELRQKQNDIFKSQIQPGRTPAELLQEAAQAQAEYEEGVKKLLDPKQQAALDAYKDRKKQNEIEATAQSVLGDISNNADISPEQRQAIIEKLRQSAEKSMENRPAGWDLMTQNFSIMGPNSAGVIDNVGNAFLDPTVSNDPAAMQKRIQEEQRRTGESRINQLKDILTPAQLSQYRAAMDSRLNLARSMQIPAARK